MNKKRVLNCCVHDKKERIGREKQIDIGIELVFKTQPLFMI